MSIVNELLGKPGVIAAGEYAYRGDRFSFKGDLSEEHARMASIMSRATTMGATMEARMLAAFRPQCGIQPARGWVLRGPSRTMCVVTNVFCLVDNGSGSLNDILGFMGRALADERMDLV